MKHWQSIRFWEEEELGEWLDRREQEVEQLQVVWVTALRDTDNNTLYAVLISYWEPVETAPAQPSSMSIATLAEKVASLEAWAAEMENRFVRHQGRPHGGPTQ